MWCLARRSGCSLSSIWSALRLEIRSVGRSGHTWFVTGLVTRWCPRWPLPGTPTMTCVTSTENRPPPHHQTKKNQTNAVNKEWLPKGKCHCTRMSTAWPGNRWPHLYLPAHFRVFLLPSALSGGSWQESTAVVVLKTLLVALKQCQHRKAVWFENFFSLF